MPEAFDRGQLLEMKHENLIEAIDAARKTSRGVTYIEGEHNEVTLTYAEIYNRALALLHHFQAKGAGPGSKMIILLASNEQFIDAFWACLLGRITPVPIAVGNTEEQRLRLFHVATRLNDAFICSGEGTFGRYAGFADSAGISEQAAALGSRAVLLEQLEDSGKQGVRHEPSPDDLALLQFSSGSTSAPKGVQLTHRNITANLDGVVERIGFSLDDATLSWMPLTHDMGLIGYHLTPLSLGLDQYLMATEVFVRRPLLWLKKTSEKRATVLCSPNFGYRHFLRVFDHAKSGDLDLSPVRLILNGAEPISAELCREFTDALASSGLKASAMFPVYGLAEASVAVTFPQPGSGVRTVAVDRNSVSLGAAVRVVDAADSNALTLVKVGQPVKHTRIRLRDDDGKVLGEGFVGHIQIAGDNVTQGFYDSTSGEGVEFTEDGWLDTGDVGFLHDDDLCITGRAKEIIFSGGQNHFPHDLEALLESVPEIGLNKAVVCGARRPNAAVDEVVAFILHRGDAPSFVPIAHTVRRRITEGAGLPVSNVVPVKQIPKTTSGKLQRFLLRERYLAGEFDAAIAEVAALEPAPSEEDVHPAGAIEQQLLEICAQYLQGRKIGVHDNIFELGTSSLVLAQIYEQLEKTWPNQLAITDFFDYPTVAKLAAYLESKLQQPMPA